MTEDEITKIRARVHNLADVVHAHEIRLAQHTIMIDAQSQHYESLRKEMVTSAELTTAVTIVTMKIQQIADDLSPIQSNITWAIRLIAGAIIMAGLGLLLVK